MAGEHRTGFWHDGRRYELREWHDAPSVAERAAGLTVVRGEAQARWILAEAARGRADRWSDDALHGGARRLDRWLDDLRLGRRVLVQVDDARPAVDHLARYEEEIVDLADLVGPDPYEDTWVEFVFEYSDGTKVTGLEYVLVDPLRKETPGTLAASGTITRRGVTPGDYTVVLKEVEHVVWVEARAQVGDDLPLVARTSGYPDGTPVTVKLYRERIESAGDEVATVQAEVRGDVVEATLQWTPTPEDTTQAGGEIALVAEVSLDGGKVWAKTQRPLALRLPALESVRWSSDRAQVGDAIEIVVRAPGHAPGTEVALELWRLDWNAGDAKVVDLDPVTLVGDEASVRCVYAGGSSAHAEGAVIERSGEYYVVATIAGATSPSARSELLWCAWDPAQDTDADMDTSQETAAPDTRAA